MTTPQTEALRAALVEKLNLWERAHPATTAREALFSDLCYAADRLAKERLSTYGALSFAYRALLTSEREASARREAVLREALEKVAHQETTPEMESTNLNYEGDFEDAYDTIIGIARAALNNGDAG